MHGGLILPLGEHGGHLARGLIIRVILSFFLVMAGAIGVEFSPVLCAFFKGWPIMEIGFLVCGAGYFLSYHLAARRLIKAEYRVCLKCRKPLPGGKEWGKCPSCTHYYNLPDIKAEFESPFSFTGPAHLPVALRKYRRVAAAGGAMMTAAPLLEILHLSLKHFGWVFGGLMFGGIAAAVTALLLERRLLARVKRAGYRACPGCEYSLESSGAKGKCPECGRGFDEDLLRHDWERCVRKWQ